MGTIKVMPNQSMLDVILQGCGSLEAGMQFCSDNGIAISDYPAVGTIYQVSNNALTGGDTGVLQYLAQNGVVIGTLGVLPVLGFKVVLKPIMQVQPDPDPPSISGYYSYNFIAAPGFININAIASGDYPSVNNPVSYQNEERIIEGFAPGTTEDTSLLPMSARFLQYKIPWVVARGLMMIWSDLGAAEKTATFVDVLGNQAYMSPLIVLDSTTQAVAEYLIADLEVELVSAAHNTVTLRLTRNHEPVIYADFVVQVLTWLYDAAGGTPDPLDPANPDKTIVTLPAGTYTFGIATVYMNVTFPYPPSSFSMVVEIG